MMFSTFNSTPEDVRRKEVDFLNQRLADSIDLVYQAKQAHWNIKGMEFRSLHKLFDRVATTVDKYVDRFAERLVQLGGVTEGTIQSAVKNTSLPEYPVQLLTDVNHVSTICERVSQYGKFLREGIEFCSNLEDETTADLFIDASRDIDELTWMIESHIFNQEKVGIEAPIELEQPRRKKSAVA